MNTTNIKKTIAAVVAMVVIGGASGAGGAYAVNNLFNNTPIMTSADAPASSVKNNMGPVGTSGKSNSAADSIILMQSEATEAQSGAVEMLESVRPSIAFITSKLEGQSIGGGTGIVMSADGYIVTNAHVVQEQKQVYDQTPDTSFNNPFSMFGFGFGGSYHVEVVDADEITVNITPADGSEAKDYAAKIVGVDTTTDLAVLKIDATGLTAAKVGDSSKLKIGETCYALGYPLGVGLSASDGIISGLDRNIGIEMQNGKTQDIALIQTTAAINPGNSGGALLDSAGNVIGITSAKLVSNMVEGFGFAIPITTAMPIISELMTNGKYEVVSPTIGISGSNLTATAARYYGLPVTSGVLVETVEEGKGADKAGIAPGDIIIKADGTEIATMDELTAIKNKHKTGETMVLTIARETENVDLIVTL